MSRIFGLLCPTNPAHGFLLPWPEPRGWFCPHQAHGANGRFFTTPQAEGKAPTSRSPQHEEPEAAGRTSSGVGRAGDFRAPVPETALR
jgi:hypothetical protein